VNSRLKKHFKKTMVSGLFASMSCMYGVAGAVTEVEPNDVQSDAQVLLVPANGLSVSALMGIGAPTTTDLDIYAFDAKAGDVPTIMVVSDGSWDPLLVLYDSLGNILDMNDDAYPMNPSSVSPLDSRIDMHRISSDGTYYAVVTPMPRFLQNSFTPVFPDPGAGGAYTLMAQGVTAATTPVPVPPVVIPEEPEVIAEEPEVIEEDPEVIAEEPEVVEEEPEVIAEEPDVIEEEPEVIAEVPEPVVTGDGAFIATIQVKDWHGKVAQNGKKSKGKKGKGKKGKKGKKRGIPVAIISAPGFDAMDINRDSLTFGATGDERSLMSCRKKGKDVKVDKVKDGNKDLVCYFKADATGFQENDVQGILRGTWVDEDGVTQKFEGSAALSVLIVTNKKGESWHVRHGVNPRGKRYKEHKRGKKTGHHKHGKHNKHSRANY